MVGREDQTTEKTRNLFYILSLPTSNLIRNLSKPYSAYIYTIRKMFDCKKCHTHLVSFIKHHGLFVPYIVDIFFLIRESWLSPSYIHPVQEF